MRESLARFGLAPRFGRWLQTALIFAIILLSSNGRAEAPQAPPIDKNAILNHLNAAISWYHHVASLDSTAGQPSDALYLQSARDSAGQALQLAFQSALAAAELAKSNKAGQATGQSSPGANQQQAFAKAITETNDRISQTQTQLDDLNKQLETARGKKREQLLSQRTGLQGQLDLDKMIVDALQKISSVNTNNENNTTGFAGEINQLKRSVPEVFATATTRKEGQTPAAPQTSKSSRAESSGLLGQTTILFGQVSDIREVDQLMSETTRLSNIAEKLDAPLRESLKSLIQQGRDLANQSSTDDAATVEAKRQEFVALTSQFKAISAAAIPLRQEILLLDETRGDLQEWRNSIDSEYDRVLRSLLTRVAVILIALAFVFFLSEIWRRATYRYVREPRLRRQLMLIRRFVMSFLTVVVIALGFISEFSSLATFAGFITAGIAVALQTVILSIAAYFFLIGRYGVRVGDRITVGGVTGDVIDIGLVRIYLLELSGTGIALHPTGRVVVFSNSVMFQATPFFKQLPGTAYAWHELAVMLAPDTNYSAAEKKLLDAVNSVYAQYRSAIDRQHSLVERLIETTFSSPSPASQLNFVDTGLEFVVRYPVEIARSSEIDDKMTRKLLEVIEGDPELKAAVMGLPKLRASIKA